jgi:hypothetical protein
VKATNPAQGFFPKVATTLHYERRSKPFAQIAAGTPIDPAGNIDTDTEVSMARSKFRRSLRFENLEGRQLLSSGGPTDQEQYMLQLLNEARTNPAAAAQQITSNLTPEVQATLQYYGVNLQAAQQTIATATPQPPLAWNAALAVAAQGQSQYQATNQIQSHTGAGGSTSQQRIQAAGYTNSNSSGENAYAYATSPEEAMQAFLIDWGVPSDGHRINIQQPNVSAQNAYRDVGIGIVQTNPNNPSFGPMVITQDFGSRPNSQAQLVGVVYSDNSGTNFYQPGEGQGGVQIDAVNLQSGEVLSTQTWSSGGSELSLPAGQYQVIASLNDTVIQTVNVTVADVNIEQDFITSNAWQGGTRESAIAAAQPPAPVAVVSPPVVSAPIVSPPVVSIPVANPQPSTPQPIAVGWVPVVQSAPTTPAQQSVLSLLASRWSAWNAS